MYLSVNSGLACPARCSSRKTSVSAQQRVRWVSGANLVVTLGRHSTLELHHYTPRPAAGQPFAWSVSSQCDRTALNADADEAGLAMTCAPPGIQMNNISHTEQ